MKIYQVEPDWMLDWDNHPKLKLLVDKIPESSEMFFERKGDLLYAEKDGYVLFNTLSSDHNGYAGRKFNFNMKDGTTLEWVGPWSSRAGVMNKAGFTPCVEVSLTNDHKAFQRGYTFCGAAVTVKLIQDFLEEHPRYFEIVEKDSHGEPCWQPVMKKGYYRRIYSKFGLPKPKE